MSELRLEAKNSAQQRIKEYLEQNASDVLADKINNGVSIEKDGKVLTNRKTLDSFMKYATEEARKVAENGVRCACIEDIVVFGWAIHYFEEDSIEGTLYNEDGTEYAKQKSAPKKASEKKVEKVETTKETLTPPNEENTDFPVFTPKKKKITPKTSSTQLSFFDF